jgi:uncharacterized protein (TIGR02145 family)
MGTGSFTSYLTGLITNTFYYVRAYATNSEGTSYGDEIAFAPFFNCGIVNYEGQVYHTVVIGGQCWFEENLNVGTMITNSPSNNRIIEKHCYDDNEANCSEYGGFYSWDELMNYTIDPGTQGICPNGWHIPTVGEYQIMADHLGGVALAGGKMKESGNAHWMSPNTGATNESGFTALPGGNYYHSGYSSELGYSATFYTSDWVWDPMLWDIKFPFYAILAYNSEYLGYDKVWPKWFRSVRCLKD